MSAASAMPFGAPTPPAPAYAAPGGAAPAAVSGTPFAPPAAVGPAPPAMLALIAPPAAAGPAPPAMLAPLAPPAPPAPTHAPVPPPQLTPLAPEAQSNPDLGDVSSPWTAGPRLDTTSLPSAHLLARPEPSASTARVEPAVAAKAPRGNGAILGILAVIAIAAVGTLVAIAMKHGSSSDDPISVGVKDDGHKAPEEAPTATAAPSASASAPKHLGRLPQKPAEDIYDDIDDKPKPAKTAGPGPLPPSPVPTSLPR